MRPNLAAGESVRLATVVWSTTDTSTVVGVSGELDMATAGSFGAALAGVIGTRRPNVVIDASRLGFCDSAGLAAVELAADLAAACGGTITMVGARPGLRSLLRITGTDRRFLRPGPSLRGGAPC
ncbi:STAS domain-containing protein [Actinomadura sp. 21ATH]|uniref:STAS domain-containing protein n=1 Tax=Actinomadura sp. 21ATH TaxID=1735444 RepID=UPI0035C0037C